MSPPETREQRLEAKRKKMPLELADLHWHLEDELTWMHVTWKEYLELFAAHRPNERNSSQLLSALRRHGVARHDAQSLPRYGSSEFSGQEQSNNSAPR